MPQAGAPSLGISIWKEKEMNKEIAAQFKMEGTFQSIKPLGNGLINDTFVVEQKTESQTLRFVLQRINHAIFKNPIQLMENIFRVTDHIQTHFPRKDENGFLRNTMTVIPTQEGELCLQTESGDFWRVYSFMENTLTFDSPDKPENVFEAARAFGEFQSWIADLPSPRLHETIPDFHHTQKRFQALEKSIEENKAKRAEEAKNEIEFALERKELASVLVNLQKEGKIPERITHNDTKINNVLLDKTSGKGICVIDLDTVMPGLTLYDFGDMVRTMTCRAAEDEPDLSKVNFEVLLFESLAKGYLSSASKFLTPIEKDHLVLSGKLICFEQGIRFLKDYLDRDIYYKTTRKNQNLDRTRTQFKLVEEIENQEKDLIQIIKSI